MNLNEVANKLAIQTTVNSLFALALGSADIISIRIEYSSKMSLLNVIVFDENTTNHAHNVVLIDKELALEELLNIEDYLIERIAIRRDQIESEDAA
ncbi:TPA: hypothetical protein KD853_000723 [Vibrio parahaemolyticus]|uniref:Uncharacterized protein n=1 Tax=Vibrio parahaemolyticus TaxID=670 RepID=A0AA46Z7N7_VIBPH|nr:hypothetical protein [Vibrio parahaemolyticus]EGR1734073.1 hypothetical protein [Vibrio parahaemolyticus]EIV8657106.1 hypothetical protein [Vibrio parahaemolyticus]MBE3925875.1 hypothetical protein [Vibrio parahaemolyticus]MBE5148427.1 hypothetical protein [Vibrio parahaemolyticus]MCC3785353.1 hypothetical protein [Vibrio parahaemolyticus]